MKWIFTILLLVAAAGSCEPLQAKSKDWSEKDQKLWKSYLTLSAIDTYQAFKMIDCQKQPHCPIVERNPLLGERPKKGEVVALKLVGNLIIYQMLEQSPNQRTKALRWLNGVQGLVVTHNGFYYYKKF